MLKDERRNQIIRLVEQKKNVTCAELSDTFHVTQQTIRRDLDYLDSKSKLKKAFGGAISLSSSQASISDPSFHFRKTTFLEKKKRIARAAADLIDYNDTIALDVSTTTLQMIPFLPEDKHITVITNSLSALFELYKKKNIKVVALGGELRYSSTSLLGYLALDNLANFNINKLFLSANSVSVKRGLMDPNIQELEIKRAMLDISAHSIFLANSEKFNTISTYTVCPVSDLDLIITDSELSSEIISDFQGEGVEFHTV